ncbi:MAG: hypothetical protein AABX13_06050 [Nanoarchaeota archaeon]
MATIKQALKYPFINFARLWNYWWFLVPLWGWLVVNGYVVRIINEIRKGKSEELPAIRPFKGLFETGFFLGIALLVPGLTAFLLTFLWGWLRILAVYLILITPVLVLQFTEKRRIRDGMNVLAATKLVFTHFGLFVLTWLKTAVVIIVWALASLPVITLLITLPAITFGKYRLFTDFYVQATEVQKKKEKAARRQAIEKDISVSISFKKRGK